MVEGIHLTLLLGPGVPVPAPAHVVEALDRVQVSAGGPRGGFQLTFAVGRSDPLVTTLLPAGYLDPMVTRVILVVTVNGTPQVLIDGVVTRQEMAPADAPGRSTLTVTGEDLSVLMDVVEMPFMRYPAMPTAARITAILAKYAAFGVLPAVVPPIVLDVPAPTDRVPTHQGTDLEYIRLQAQRSGYTFYLEPGPAPGTSVAYFGPDIRVPEPQAALSVGMDGHSNVESLQFSLDGMAKKVTILTILDPVTKKIPVPVPVPNVNVLRPPLGARPLPPSRVEFPSGMSGLSVAGAAKRALGISLRASQSVSGSGSLNVLRYGRVLRARRLVGVRGAGLAYDGLYYVDRVTHEIRRGEYTQSFSLSRDGLVSQTPVVAP